MEKVFLVWKEKYKKETNKAFTWWLNSFFSRLQAWQYDKLTDNNCKKHNDILKNIVL